MMQFREIAMALRRAVYVVVLTLTLLAPAYSTSVTIQLAGDKPITRHTLSYTCDVAGSKMGLPAGRFSVEYLSGAGNNLAIVPIQGMSLILSNVASEYGAQYVAQQYTWWESGENVTVSLDTLMSKRKSSCRKVSQD
jgi:membrane-bound inhibitor of C-type lysozyme